MGSPPITNTPVRFRKAQYYGCQISSDRPHGGHIGESINLLVLETFIDGYAMGACNADDYLSSLSSSSPTVGCCLLYCHPDSRLDSDYFFRYGEIGALKSSGASSTRAFLSSELTAKYNLFTSGWWLCLTIYKFDITYLISMTTR